MSRFAVLLGLLLLVACSSPDTGSAPAGDEAPVGDVALGEDLYQANCAQCHGADLRGTDQGPPHLDIVYEPSHHADITFTLAIRNGVRPHHWDFGPMPPVPGLSDADIASIVAYVRAEQRAVGIGE